MADTRVKKGRKTGVGNLNPAAVLLNSLIGALTLVILLFAYSLYDGKVRRDYNIAALTGGNDLEEIPTATLLAQEKISEEMDLVVRILNGCGVPGIAARAKTALVGLGVDVVDVDNADSRDYSVTTILYHGANVDKAMRFCSLLKLSPEVIREGDAAALGNDLTLVLGKDYSSVSALEIPRENIRLQILNGCGASGISRKYKNYFESRGINVVDVKNAANFNYDRTQIRYDNAALTEDAENMKDLLGLADDQVRKVNELGNPNITLIIGRDYKYLLPAEKLGTR